MKQKKSKDDKEMQDEKRKILFPFGLRKKISNMEKEVGRANKRAQSSRKARNVPCAVVSASALARPSSS